MAKSIPCRCRLEHGLAKNMVAVKVAWKLVDTNVLVPLEGPHCYSDPSTPSDKDSCTWKREDTSPFSIETHGLARTS